MVERRSEMESSSLLQSSKRPDQTYNMIEEAKNFSGDNQNNQSNIKDTLLAKLGPN